MSDYPMLISNKLHSFRNFLPQSYHFSKKPGLTYVIVSGDLKKKIRRLEKYLPKNAYLASVN